MITIKCIKCNKEFEDKYAEEYSELAVRTWCNDCIDILWNEEELSK